MLGSTFASRFTWTICFVRFVVFAHSIMILLRCCVEKCRQLSLRAVQSQDFFRRHEINRCKWLSKRRKRSNSARKQKHMELRAIASFASKVRVRDLGTRMKRAWSNERRHRSFSLVYVLPKWNVYKLKSFSQNSFYFTSFVRSGRITGPVSIFLMGHFVALCAIRAWRTAFLIPESYSFWDNDDNCGWSQQR